MTPPETILIVKPSSLGDIVHTLPAVALLRRQWPSASIRWLINPEWAPLLDGSPLINEVILFPRGEFRGWRGWTRVPRWAKAMAARKADLVLDFQGLLRSALISRICRGRWVVGLSDAREGARFFSDQQVSVAGWPHAVDRYLALIAGIGVPKAEQLDWLLPAGVRPKGFGLERFLLLHPFARGAGKSLSAPQLAEFCSCFRALPIVIAGRHDQPVTTAGDAVDLVNRTTLLELVWLIRHAACVVSVDSGPMHIAAAVNPKLVAIHTWSDPAKVGPYSRGVWIWKDGNLRQVKDWPDQSPGLPCADMSALARFVTDRLV